MAFTASILFTDAEQAVISQAAAIAAPGATAAQIKTWIQEVGKKAVREKVTAILQEELARTDRAARMSKGVEIQNAWPLT